MELYYGALILSNCLLAISVFFGISKWSLLQKQGKWYLYYLSFILCVELIVKFLIFILDAKNTYYVYPFYISGEFLLLSCMFIAGLNLSRNWYILSGTIASIIFVTTIFLIINNQDVTNNICKIFSHLLIISIAGYCLIKELKDFEKENKFLVIYACLFLYYSISLFFFLLLDQLTAISDYDAYIIWGMNNILSSILYGVSTYTFIKLKK